MVALLARKRIGFLIDAAVLGFAVGTGFAVVENFVFLQAMPDSPTMLWVVRGLGTATLHGATTPPSRPWWPRASRNNASCLAAAAGFAGVATAIVIHSAYNHLLLPPLASTIVLLIGLPLPARWSCSTEGRGRRRMGGQRARPGPGAPGIAHLAAVSVDQLQPPVLQELKSRFEGPVVADMVCLLRLQLELSVQARALADGAAGRSGASG